MKHLLNTLYVTTKGAFLSKEGDTVIVSVEKEEKLRVPAHILDSVVLIGGVSCTPFLIGLCNQYNITISFLSPNGRFLGRVHGPTHGNVLLRREQYRRADDPLGAALIARNVVMAKLANCRTVLMRAARDRSENASSDDLRLSSRKLAGLIENVRHAQSKDSVRGIEGIAAAEYFSVFDNLISAQKEHFKFHGRNRRPPMDNVNTLISFYYTLLVHDVTSALEGVGLDPAVGFLHADRPGRPSLALDIMEELRPVLADRLALNLINRKQLSASSFSQSESGAVKLCDEARKTVIIAYQERKHEELIHPFLKEKVAVGLLPHIQALLLARHLRGDLDEYPPFFWK